MPRYAAIDIGSNSIRMAAAEVVPGEVPQTLALDREVVRLGESVFRNGALSESAIALACSVLTRMAETYHKLDVIGVRAVATSAVRDARNQEEFIQRATQAIGSPIEIVSGPEEARLIHLGVQSTWPHSSRRLLIIDIGGGSAEIIASENGLVREVISKPLGAVRLKEMFLGEDPPAPKHLHQMREFIDDKLAGAVRRQGEGPWHRVIGTSASASAVVCAVNRVPRSKREAADRLRASLAQIRQLYQRLSTHQPRRAAEGDRYRTEARRDHRARRGRADARAGDVPSAFHVLFGRRGARWNHRRSGSARRGARTGAVEPRPAQGSGADGAALRRVAGARPRRGRYGARNLHRYPTAAPVAAALRAPAGGGRVPA